MISILIPARRESIFIEGLIESIYETAEGKDFEVIVSMSENDKRKFKGAKTIYQDKSLGRWGLHEYMNALCKEAKGDLLWHICDDYRFIHEGWDEVLSEYLELSDKVYYLLPAPAVEEKISGFVAPLITRKWYETVGHWANGYSVDSWVGEIAGYLPQERQVNIPLNLRDLTYAEPEKHGAGIPREDLDEDREKIDEYLKTRVWSCPEIREEIKADAKRLNHEIQTNNC